MTSSDSASPTPTSRPQAPKILYRERQWVPWYFWLMAAIVIGLFCATASLNRSIVWAIVPGVLLGALAVWVLVTWSNTIITVERKSDGTRWLKVKGAQLPHDVVARSLAVPASARRAALGPQLDPAAFLVTHGWIQELAMLVLDDEEDPTPYWLVCTKDPEALLRAFVPEQADAAVADL